jgi:hypothetical protein
MVVLILLPNQGSGMKGFSESRFVNAKESESAVLPILLAVGK